MNASRLGDSQLGPLLDSHRTRISLPFVGCIAAGLASLGLGTWMLVALVSSPPTTGGDWANQILAPALFCLFAVVCGGTWLSRAFVRVFVHERGIRVVKWGKARVFPFTEIATLTYRGARRGDADAPFAIHFRIRRNDGEQIALTHWLERATDLFLRIDRASLASRLRAADATLVAGGSALFNALQVAPDGITDGRSCFVWSKLEAIVRQNGWVRVYPKGSRTPCFSARVAQVDNESIFRALGARAGLRVV